MSQIAPNTLHNVMQAQNIPVDSGHFNIDIWTLDDEGDRVKRLSEFGSTIVSWSFEPAPMPDFVPDDSELHFDDEIPVTQVGPGGKVQKPTLTEADLAEDDEYDDEEEDDEEDEADFTEDYRELVLTHQVTGAAFNELNKHVFDHEHRPEVSVQITYYVEIDTQEVAELPANMKKVPIFTHVFYGVFYVPEDISGNRAIGGMKQGPLLLVTKMEVLGSKVYADPADTDMLARVLQEYAGSKAH